MPLSIAVTDGNGDLKTVATNDALAAILGEVQTTPTTYTLADRLKAVATLLGGTLTVGDGGGSITVDGTFWQATQPVSAAALPLPSGAATEVTLAALNTKVTAVNTGAVTVAGSALPTGASTAANQATAIAGLASIDGHVDGLEASAASIDGKLPALSGGRVPVDVASHAVTNAGTFAVQNTAAIPAGANQIGTVAIKDISNGEYETVAASQTAQVLGATGAAGDYLSGLLIVPATTSPGAVSVKDGNGSDITVFTGGASSVSNLVPFFVPLGTVAVNATTPGWKVTTGANVSVIGVGNFT